MQRIADSNGITRLGHFLILMELLAACDSGSTLARTPRKARLTTKAIHKPIYLCPENWHQGVSRQQPNTPLTPHLASD